MWQRFSLYDLRVIGHYLGTLTQLFAALMAVPFITALVFQEWEPAERYLFGIGIALVVGTLLQFLRIEPGRLGRRQALAVTGLARSSNERWALALPPIYLRAVKERLAVRVATVSLRFGKGVLP